MSYLKGNNLVHVSLHVVNIFGGKRSRDLLLWNDIISDHWMFRCSWYIFTRIMSSNKTFSMFLWLSINHCHAIRYYSNPPLLSIWRRWVVPRRRWVIIDAIVSPRDVHIQIHHIMWACVLSYACALCLVSRLWFSPRLRAWRIACWCGRWWLPCDQFCLGTAECQICLGCLGLTWCWSAFAISFGSWTIWHALAIRQRIQIKTM